VGNGAGGNSYNNENQNASNPIRNSVYRLHLLSEGYGRDHLSWNKGKAEAGQAEQEKAKITTETETGWNCDSHKTDEGAREELCRTTHLLGIKSTCDGY